MSRLLNWANTRAHKERGFPAGSLFGPSDLSRFAASAEVSPGARTGAAQAPPRPFPRARDVQQW